MRYDVEQQEMNSEQLLHLSYQTCQWWNAVFVQARRFLDASEVSHGDTPWDEGGGSMLVVERMFLITAIYHAIEDLRKLGIEMQRRNDNSLQPVLESIQAVASFEDIKNMRDMNEHGLDYLVGKGRKPDQYQLTVHREHYKLTTTPAWTFIDGNEGIMLLGNVEITKLLLVMKEHLPLVHGKTKEIFNKEPLG